MSLFDCRLRGALAVLVLFLGVLLPAGAAEIARTQCAQTPSSPAALPAIARQRAHPAYQVFAAKTHLPGITVLEEKTLNIGGGLKLDFRNATPMSAEQAAAVGTLLAIPGKTSSALVQNLSTQAELSGEELALQFRRAILDYKYLLEKWGHYRPLAGGESVKVEALKRLEA